MSVAHVVIVGAGEHVSEPSLRIDIVEPRGLDQRIRHGGAPAAAIGAGEQPGLAAERDATSSCCFGECQRAFAFRNGPR